MSKSTTRRIRRSQIESAAGILMSAETALYDFAPQKLRSGAQIVPAPTVQEMLIYARPGPKPKKR